jgi:hypothetical protein
MKNSTMFGIAFAISALFGGLTAKDNKFVTGALIYGLIGGTSATVGFAIGKKVFKSNEEYNAPSSNDLTSNRSTTSVPRYNSYSDRQAALATDRFGNRTRVVADTSDDFIAEVPQFEVPDAPDWGNNNTPTDNVVQEVSEQSKPWSNPDTSTPEVYTLDSPPPYLAEPTVQHSYTPEPYQSPAPEPYQAPYTPDTSSASTYDPGPIYIDYSN